ncbi:MAG: hypothetical protein JWQ50_705 [Caballeronia mineralivorans]|nr:hypothetical protein [Caballeronia mineralivorans]
MSRTASNEDPHVGFLCRIEQAFGNDLKRSRRSGSLYPRLSRDLHCHDKPYPREWE